MPKLLSNILKNTNSSGLSVSLGGTGVMTLTGLVKANGTNAFVAATAGTDYLIPGGNLANCTNLSLTSGVTGTLPVANGGTGVVTLTANSVLIGNGTSPVQTVAPGTSGNVLISNGTNWTSAALSLVPTWQIKTTTYTASAKDYILANTSGGAFTITLPSSPAINDFVTIADYAGTFGTFNLTVNSNSLNLMGSVQTLIMNVSSRNVTLVYADATKGWVITL